MVKAARNNNVSRVSNEMKSFEWSLDLSRIKLAAVLKENIKLRGQFLHRSVVERQPMLLADFMEDVKEPHSPCFVVGADQNVVRKINAPSLLGARLSTSE